MKGCAHDPNTPISEQARREMRKFQKFLLLREKYGEAVLLKRKFWRIYCGLEAAKGKK